MKLLLDTHVLIWWHNEPEKLSNKVLGLLKDPSHQLLFSTVSIWEMQIKMQLGKFNFRIPLKEFTDIQKRNGLRLMPVKLSHVYALDNLPLHHRDPFDRMLIAQAQTEKATLVSQDAVFSQYPVTVLW